MRETEETKINKRGGIQRKMKNYKGITLIALVVTIVVLLILAGVSIGMLAGENGIITQATKAKENTKIVEEKEIANLAAQGAKENGYGAITKDRLQGELDNLTDGNAEVTGEGPFIVEYKDSGRKYNVETNGSVFESIAGKKYNTETDITIGTTPVTVPGGTTISGIEGEYENPDEGIVIYIIPEGEPEITDWEADGDNNGIIDVQENYDQFVWVPVPNPVATSDTELTIMMSEGKYPIAVAISGTDSNGLQNYRGALYEFSEATNAEGNKYVSISNKEWSADSTSHREPAYLADSYSADASSYNTVGITEDSLQQEFNKMVDRVKSKKGFWVGRYETSNMVGTASTSYSDALNQATVAADTTNRVTVIKGTTEGISYDSTIPNNINWYRMYAQQKNYSKLALGSTTTTTSSMIWGSQWDQIMIWMRNVKNERVTTNGNYFVTNSVGYGNYGSISGAEAYDTATSTSGPAATGSSDYFKVKNVYDLAGNVSDWTLTADGKVIRDLRGACFATEYSAFTRADLRGNYGPNRAEIYDGSRATLF